MAAIRNTRLAVLLSCALLVTVAARGDAAEGPPDEGAVKFFEQRVRPVLAERCHSCHGPQKQKNGLRLDSRGATLKGGVSGPAVTPGKPDESLLIHAIRHGEQLRMPPKAKLPPREIADLTEWVRRGAPWPGGAVARAERGTDGLPFTEEQKAFWAFRPPTPPPLPPVRDPRWATSTLDRFILAGLGRRASGPPRPQTAARSSAAPPST
jgi:mono/diheme cytochrome c family protein